ncbi:L,D-transpeptidase family protein [Streptomyces sp. NPDC020719]|uniref:L,D-transpeptidase family protein n=1 Tax=unclassified Streptomyces TaxID=2593676 RepID=UPI0033DB4EC4
MRTALALSAALLALATPAATADSARPFPATHLPHLMADTGGGTQLITAEAPSPGSTTGRLSWWTKRGPMWALSGWTEARFGGNGLVEGGSRKQGTNTTPTGLYDLPYAFGTEAAPFGTRYDYRRATGRSWWCEDNASKAYNRWVEGLPGDCRASESERITAFGTQYAHALVIGFNYDQPVRGRGAGIFLHVNGRGSTAGCVSVPAYAMDRILAWADPAKHPHIAIGTMSGPTSITRY